MLFTERSALTISGSIRFREFRAFLIHRGGMFAPKFGESAHSRTRTGHKELGFTWHCVRLLISRVEFAYHEIKITPRTDPNATTSGRTKGIGLKSTGGGTAGRRDRSRTCCEGDHRRKTTCHPCGATSRRAGKAADPLADGPIPSRGVLEVKAPHEDVQAVANFKPRRLDFARLARSQRLHIAFWVALLYAIGPVVLSMV
jgi:hypothetical protein